MIRVCEPDGPEEAKIVILTDRPGYGDLNAKQLLSDHAGRLFWESLRNGAGILRHQVRVEAICLGASPGNYWRLLDNTARTFWEQDVLTRLAALKPNLIVTLGDWPLELLTGYRSADKYHLSVLPPLISGGTKILSLLHPERVLREYSASFYLRLGAKRMQQEALFPDVRRREFEFQLCPTTQEILVTLEKFERVEWLSVDIETGQGQITCIGMAPNDREAISIPTLEKNYSSVEEYYIVWEAIAKTLKAMSKKVFQNGIYDLTYLSAYGVSVANFMHDTMAAQRILYPEFSVGLDNIARIFTDLPYWKDDAKDWSLRTDVTALYRYNAMDCVGTMQAAQAQRIELERRGLMPYFDYVMRLARGPLLEMSWRGLPLDIEERNRLEALAKERIQVLETLLNEESQKLLKQNLNSRSPKQVKDFLHALGFKRLPYKEGKETSDKGALLKLQLKSPDSPALKALLEISEVQKEFSSYLRFAYNEDLRFRYTLNVAGTETGRFSCYSDPWGRGLNAQTLPSHLKTMIKAGPGRVLIETDLCQADARVVAWDSADPILLEFYQTGQDIHRYVASQPELFNCAPGEVTKEQRQLGKKVGHAANYGVGPGTLSESCLKEMGLVISEQKAQQMLTGYYRTFPGIVRWQAGIREELSRTRALKCPTGYVKYFYGRSDQSLFKQAYAYKPQHTVAYTINQLVLWLYGKVDLLLQIHDSCLVECDEANVDRVLNLIKEQDAWNPTYQMSGGKLRIPIEIKLGRVWGKMTDNYTG